jgi:predicted TIM-barrel fold metal-dependent hydrolase
LGLPVLIHISDPAAFFHPLDERNERWGELQGHPNWSFHGDRFPAREELLAARNRLLVRHPKTTFIGAHVGNNPEDLKTVGEWLDQFPNFHVELAARISDLGRQPYTARKFIIRYADRVMFGTDGPLSELRMSIHWRFLETFDEYFAYGESSFPSQGYWNIYGLGLPEDVLRKVYYENASRIIPGVEQRIQAYVSRN